MFEKKEIDKLNSSIVNCKKCKRLVFFREKIAKEKRKMYQNETYWGKAVTGFGDHTGKLLIIGLAPAAHGGNRTGRVFTGDKSSAFLFKCLFKAGISNQEFSVNSGDRLKLNNSYLTLALKCVPPGDKPSKEELINCSHFLKTEINNLVNIKTILALGKIAFDSIVQFYKLNYSLNSNKINFKHGSIYSLPDGKKLVGCYHPSPRNVNTGRINIEKYVNLLHQVLKI